MIRYCLKSLSSVHDFIHKKIKKNLSLIQAFLVLTNLRSS
uniref:Uncharacterized protein n=1 Tax=virus sp. ctLl75 TaxID=2828249 RepID=A0A8S5RB33_9VIRU|nr:MAG TPA: hypothetical protein [virus sp. ctLl75]DAU58384.1 MAG TPA: hypothetical protein [Caudoviricetes sp.]